MSAKNVCILGASGAVGQQMLTCIEEQDLDVSNLKLLASPSSVGKKLKYRGEDVTIELAEKDAFSGQDIALSAVENDVAETFARSIVDAGAVMIDNSSAFRLTEGVPLVVADVNPQDIETHSGIIANPNCSTIIALLAVAPLNKVCTIKRMVVSTYQAASGAGMPGINELMEQLSNIAKGESVSEPKAFAAQLAMNLIPQIGDFDENGYSSEEMKMQNEGRKILHNCELAINCTCVRVPIARSHSESITIEFDGKMTPDGAREILSCASGVKLIDDLASSEATSRYPMPLYTSNQDLVMVGRIRADISAKDQSSSLTLWCTGDQIRIGAATNAVKIAKLL